MTRAAIPRPLAPGQSFDLAPFTMAWEITRSCPLRCLHCRAVAQTRRHPEELTTEEGVSLINQAAEMGVQVFVITGGDPLARRDVFELIAAGNKAGLHVGFSPSVTPRLTRDALARAIKAGARTVHLSLDGAGPEADDGFRGVKGSFERTIASINAVIELETRLQVGTSVSKRTVGELTEVARLLEGKVDLWSLFFLVPTGRADVEDVLSPEQHEEVLTWLATTEFPFPVRAVAAPSFRRVATQLGQQPRPGVNDGNGFCFVSHRGDVCPSGFLQMPVGNVRDAPLAHWYRNHPLFQALRDPERLTGKCGRCGFKKICGGSRARAWAMTGDPLGADPTCVFEPEGQVTVSA